MYRPLVKPRTRYHRCDGAATASIRIGRSRSTSERGDRGAPGLCVKSSGTRAFSSLALELQGTGDSRMSWVHTAPFALLAAVIAGGVFAALELGHQLGRRAPVLEGQAATIAGSILALVGLLFAFSFSMAGERSAARRAAAVQEVNSIGTFWLRTSLAGEPARAEMRSLVRRYVDLHFEHRDAGLETSKTKAAESEAEGLQRKLWALLIREAHGTLEPERLRLITPALNAMFDDTASLIAAGENQLPQAIIGYLLVLLIVAGVVVGYRPSTEQRNLVLWILFTIIVSGVMAVLLDLDRPRHGLIQPDTALYERLRDSLRDDPP